MADDCAGLHGREHGLRRLCLTQGGFFYAEFNGPGCKTTFLARNSTATLVWTSRHRSSFTVWIYSKCTTLVQDAVASTSHAALEYVLLHLVGIQARACSAPESAPAGAFGDIGAIAADRASGSTNCGP